jgi:hypothetical protein
MEHFLFTEGFCTRSDCPPSEATSYVGEKMKERVGGRIVVTIVNRDVPFIYIKYKWKKWKGKILPPQKACIQGSMLA